MATDLSLIRGSLPRLMIDAGRRRSVFSILFTAHIPNDNTRLAYDRAVARFCFCCEDRGLAND